jgi:multiple sugar transport system substrate-binding protein
VGLIPLQEKASKYARLDRLLFYTGLAVLIIVLPFVLWQFHRGASVLPVLGEKERTLVFVQWWQNEMDTQVLPGLIREFEDQNPGVRVELDTRSYYEVRRILLPDDPGTDPVGRSAAGQTDPVSDGEKTSGVPGESAVLPDIIGLDPRWLPVLIAGDLLEPVETGVPEEGDFPGTAKDAGQNTRSGVKPRAIPLVSCMIPLFYHTGLLQKAGFDRPPKNQTEFTAIARAVTDPVQNRYGFALALNPEDTLGLYRDILPWFCSSGTALQRDGSPAFAVTPVIDTLRFLDTLSREGLLAPDSFSKTGKDRLEDFRAGRLAMLFAPIGEVRTLRAAGVPFDITAIPGSASYIGKPVVGVTGWSIGVLRSSRYKDEAQAFLAFLAGKAGVIASETGMVPISNEPAAGSAIESDPLYAKVRDIYTAADTTSEFLALPSEAALETILGEELRLMFEGSLSPEETARTVQRRWEAVLEGE